MDRAERADRAREGAGLTAAVDWPWERLAQSNAPSHDLLVELLAPKRGERFLDVGTGAGGVALRAARAGATVTGVDVAAEAVERARRNAAEEGVEVRFELADAQALPFEDSSFDVVASAFGVNFAPSHEAAARELIRVTRRGGRLGLGLMPPESRAGELWTLIRSYRAEGDHPAAWGTEERVRELLGDAFELDVRLRESEPEPEPSPDEAWEWARTSFGPMKALLATLRDDEIDRVRDAFLEIRARYADRPKTFLVVCGTRR